MRGKGALRQIYALRYLQSIGDTEAEQAFRILANHQDKGITPGDLMNAYDWGD